MSNSMSDTLAALAERYPLISIPRGQKGPKTFDWGNKRMTPAEAASIGDQNVGLILGPKSGVIDFDGDGPQAEDSLRRLFDGNVPECPGFESVRGRHRFAEYDDRFAELGAKVAPADYPDLEIRIGAESAQTLIPPSTANGVTRRWSLSPLDCPPPVLPDFVVERIVAMKGSKSKFDNTPDQFLGNIGQELRRITTEKLRAYFDRHKIPFSLTNEFARSVFRFPFCIVRGPKHSDGANVVYVNSDGTHAWNCKHSKCIEGDWSTVEEIYGSLDPIIKLGPDLDTNVREAIQALGSAKNVYQRSGVLVGLSHDAPKPKLCQHDNGGPKLVPYVPATLAPKLTTCAQWKRHDGRSKTWKRCTPPANIVAAIDATTDLPGIPPILGIVNCPVLRSDGSVLSSPGYDPLTGLYLDSDSSYPPLMEVSEALKLLSDVLIDFPFAAPSHKSGAIAFVVTMLARPAFAGPSPLFLFDANASRAGKGLLTDVATMIVEGRKAARYTPPTSDDEFRKTITTAALSGAAYMIFDNIGGKFGGQAIENAITTGRWSDRLLGGNKSVDLELSWVWAGTANNAVLTPDMIGRTCHVRLDVKEERPELRSGFKHSDLLGYVREHRHDLAMAALSIPARYIVDGRPEVELPSWGGFEGWSALVRNAIVWAGLPDPGETRDSLREQADDETDVLRLLVDGWQELGFPSTVAAALELLEDSPMESYPKLRSAIAELPGDKRNAKNALGQLLKRFRGRVVGNRKFEKADSKKWKVVAA